MLNKKRITRRQFIVAGGKLGAAAAVLTACGPTPTPAPATEAPAAAATNTPIPEPTSTPVLAAEPTNTPAPVAEVTQDVSRRNLEQIARLSETKVNLKGFQGPMISSLENIKTFNDQLFDKKMEELTNVHVGWQAAADWGRQPLEMLMASGDIPDLIVGWYHISDDYADFGMKGALAPLNDLIAANPYLSGLLIKNPTIRAQITAADGNIYAFPAIVEKERQTEFGYWIRKDWLDELGLSVPDTVDEWYEVMKAFRQRDPNVHPYNFDPLCLIWLWGVGAAAQTNNTHFYHDGDTVKFGPLQPQWREALVFINKLYQEEIIPHDYLQLMQEGYGQERVISTGVAGTGICLNNHIEYAYKTDPKINIIGMRPPKGPYGHRELLTNWINMIYLTGTCIGSTSQNKELAARYTDLYYSDSGNALYFWGIYGDTYTEENGVRKFTDKVMKDPKMSSFEYQWTVISPTWLGGYWNKADDWLALSSPPTKAAIEVWATPPWQTIQMPTLFFTQDEREILNKTLPDLNTLVAENVAKFIDGTNNLESDYRAMVDQINGLGIKDLTAVYQAAYDRYKATLG